jgi:hypothetical protein
LRTWGLELPVKDVQRAVGGRLQNLWFETRPFVLIPEARCGQSGAGQSRPRRPQLHGET